jgi:hypothetical protein
MFAQGGDESGGVGDGTTDDFANCVTAAFSERGSAISGKTVDIEHRGSPDHPLVEHGLRLMAPSRRTDAGCRLFACSEATEEVVLRAVQPWRVAGAVESFAMPFRGPRLQQRQVA